MELRICCDASVKLERMSNVMKVDCSAGEYQINGDTLNGNIVIEGNYIRDVMETTYDFKETVPFTLVFKDRNYRVLNIIVQDFTCQEIINQGIECNFNILVTYEPKSDEEPEVEEIPMDVQIKEVPVNETVDNKIQEVELDDKVVADEAIKEEINAKYDNLLNEILEARADENFLEESKVKIRSDESKSDCRGIFAGFKENFANYKVYYTTKESDIEKICKTENISIEKVYKDNKNSDFVNKKRIIIK